ncbi:MAG: carbon-phosphorus lyase complex subunit PhnI [Treponema sp.]|nr:carbon-phosphorus lyase complex subunit PhnI [Treponema sp.]
MGYVAVKGGTKAIEESIRLLKSRRAACGRSACVDTIQGAMRGLLDQIMSEGSLYAPELAALAVKQAEGNCEESVFLLRAYRSTLQRKYYSDILETQTMRVERRISASFKDIPGGQILGATYDYTHRLLDFDLENETDTDLRIWFDTYVKETDALQREGRTEQLPHVVDYLRKDNLIKDYEKSDKDPDDITREIMQFPASRSERLQCLTRGQTGAVTSLAYSFLRTSGMEHPTVAEMRTGFLPVTVPNPLGDSETESLSPEEDSYYIGSVEVTEAETIIPQNYKENDGTQTIRFQIGYGLCYGQNESKAIAMGILDYCLENKGKQPVNDEEFVLMSIDAMESAGFISHLKLPHYVTFQSCVKAARSTHRRTEKDDE